MANIEHSGDKAMRGLAERAQGYHLRIDALEARVEALNEENERLATQHRGAVEAITEWMRGDEAEAISNQAIRDEIPPEDALAHAIDQRFG